MIVITDIFKNVQYPQELHNMHSDYPLKLERISIKQEMVSNKQTDILECYERQGKKHNKWYRAYWSK